MNDDDAEPVEPKADKESDDRDDDGAGRRTTLMIVAAAAVVIAAIAFGIYLIATSGNNDVAADPAPPTISDVKPSGTPSRTLPAEGKPATPVAPHSSAAPPPPVNPNVKAARVIAENAAEAINERDVAAMKQVSCNPGTVGSVEAFPPGATARLTENPEISGNRATAQIELSISDSEPTTVPLPLEKHGGRWCVP